MQPTATLVVANSNSNDNNISSIAINQVSNQIETSEIENFTRNNIQETNSSLTTNNNTNNIKTNNENEETEQSEERNNSSFIQSKTKTEKQQKQQEEGEDKQSHTILSEIPINCESPNKLQCSEKTKNSPNHRACVICWDKKRVVRLPCGHIVMCESCATKMKTDPQCPTCRAAFHRFTVNDKFSKFPSFTGENDIRGISGHNRNVRLVRPPTKICTRENNLFECLIFLLVFLSISLHIATLSADQWLEYNNPHLFFCGDSMYINSDVAGDGVCDCPDGSDEPGKCFNCHSKNQSVSLTSVRDGICHCADGSDEDYECDKKITTQEVVQEQYSANQFWNARYIRIQNAGVLSCSCSWDLYEIEVYGIDGNRLDFVLDSVSSEARGYSAAYLTDRSLRTQWSGSPNLFPLRKEKVQWLLIDLGQVREISNISLYQSKYEIQFNIDLIYVETSNDTIVWLEQLHRIGPGWTSILRNSSTIPVGPCNCTFDGMSSSAKAVRNCGKHNTSLSEFCYTRKGYNCSNSIPSFKYPGATYIYCGSDSSDCSDSNDFIDENGNTCKSIYQNNSLSICDDDVNVASACQLACQSCRSNGCRSLRVSGINNPTLMGLYHIISNYSGGRPIYKNSNSNYLYFSTKIQRWLIANNLDSSSFFYQNLDISSTPELIEFAWLDDSKSMVDIRVDCLDIESFVPLVTTTELFVHNLKPRCLGTGSLEICDDKIESCDERGDLHWCKVISKIRVNIILALTCTFQGAVLKRILVFQGFGEILLLVGCAFTCTAIASVEYEARYTYTSATVMGSFIFLSLATMIESFLVVILVTRFVYTLLPVLFPWRSDTVTAPPNEVEMQNINHS